VQAALSVVLLVGAGLFVRSLRNVRALDLGLQPDRVLAVSPRWPRVSGVVVGEAERERARRDTAVDRAAAYLTGRPEYEAAGVAVGTPFQSTFGLDTRVAGWDSLPAMAGGGPFISAVSGGYLAAVGTRVLTGRGFTRADGAGSERVALVSRTTARTLWPGREATGQCVYVDSAPCARVVGIVADAKRFQLREEPALQFYIPLGQERGMGGRLLLVRPRCPAGACDLGAAAEPLRRALRDARLGLPYLDIRPLQRAIDPQIRPWRLGTAMFGVFGALAFLVAAVGLYGALAYGVAQRRQEIGVRMALGARAAQVVRLVLGEGLRVTLLGAVVGAAAALVGGRFLAGLLFDVRPTDPAVFAAVVGLVVVVAAAASLVPAWRATRVDPAEVLRAD
jgi:predicted permease